MKAYVCFLMAFLGAFLFQSCEQEPDVVKVTGIEMDKNSVEIYNGETVQLKADIESEGSGKVLAEWSSTDENVASVDESGLVTGIGYGEAEIVASAGGKFAYCSVKVKGAKVETLDLSEKEIVIVKGDVFELKAIVEPSEAVADKVEWKSSDPTIAEVDGNGKVTGISAGKATVTASVQGLSAECAVTVEGIAVEEIILDRESLDMLVGEKIKIKAEVRPADAEYELAWTSSDEKVAVVKDGEIEAVSAGNAVITVSASGVSAVCNVTVNNPAAHVGDYYYSDGTWSSELDEEKELLGIVFWTGNAGENDVTLKKDHPNCTNGLVIAIGGDSQCAFQSKYADYGLMIDDWLSESSLDLMPIVSGTGMEDNINKTVGYNNTKVLEAFNADPANSQWKADVMEKLAEYRAAVKAPESSSGWYIPSLKELSLLCSGEYDANIWDMTFDHWGESFVENRDRINTILSGVEGADKLQTKYYLSSDEGTLQNIYVLGFDNGNSYNGYKEMDDNRVRFILAF